MQTQLVGLIEQHLSFCIAVSTLNGIRAGRGHWFNALHLERRHFRVGKFRLGQHQDLEYALLA